MNAQAFEVVAGDALSPVILHVPHAATQIPSAVRAGLLIDDATLDREIRRSTDAHTDQIAISAAAGSAVRPWCFVNRLSRLVVDPERFPDERERMRSVGRGAVYTRTSDGEVLRSPTGATERQLIAEYFDPYAHAMEDLVAERLEAIGHVVIIDLHSYPSVPMAYERPGLRRPQLCLGVDSLHTPAYLVTVARSSFGHLAEIIVNQPYSGAYVPIRWYGKDPRVEAIMLEMRRDIYLDEETGSPTSMGPSISATRALIETASLNIGRIE